MKIFMVFLSKKKNPEMFLKKLENYRIKYKKENKNFKNIRRNIRNFFSNLYVIKIPVNFLKNKFYNSKNIKISKNFDAIEKLIDKYNTNIFFVQLKERNAIIHGKEYETHYVEKFIISKTKNHFTCDFDDDINNFYVHDGHPNKKGYKSLYECVLKIMNSNI